MKQQHRWLWPTLFLGWWTAYGALYASRYWRGAQMGGQPISVGRALVIGLLDMYSWALLALAAWWLARRIPLEQGRRVRAVVLHAVLGLALIFGRAVAIHLLVFRSSLWETESQFTETLYLIPFQFSTYAMLVGVGYAISFYQRYRSREVATARLEAQLTGARLQALKMQMHPHFLFNTLHAISALMHRDVEAADRMVARLSDLLRITLAHEGTQEVPLRQELEFLKPYLEIEQTRFGDRVQVRFDIPPDVLDAQVPHFILQPLVENSIRHGIAPRAGPGCIEIGAQRNGDQLCLQVRDDGCGLGRAASPAQGQGVGVSNTRARLEQLYGVRQHFRLADAPGGGTIAEVSIPYREAADQVTPTLHDKHGEDPDADRRRRAVGTGANSYAASG